MEAELQTGRTELEDPKIQHSQREQNSIEMPYLQIRTRMNNWETNWLTPASMALDSQCLHVPLSNQNRGRRFISRAGGQVRAFSDSLPFAH